MTSYIITGHSKDGSVFATGSVTLGPGNTAHVNWINIKEQASTYSKVVAESIITDAPYWIHKLTMTKFDDTSNVSKCGLDPYDIDRMHEKNWVMLDIPNKSAIQYAYPMQVVHDTGKKVWVGSSYSDEWPEEVKPVGDGSDKGYDTNGNCLVSVPVTWCTFYTEQDANNIIQCIEADVTLISYM